MKGRGIAIRRARKSDLHSLAALFRREFAKPPYREKWGVHGSRRKISGYLNGKGAFRVLIASAPNALAGFAVSHHEFWFGKDFGFIDEIVVAEKFRRSGIGSALLRESEKEFRKKGITESFLLALHGAGATGFYKKLGYRKTGWALLAKKI